MHNDPLDNRLVARSAFRQTRGYEVADTRIEYFGKLEARFTRRCIGRGLLNALMAFTS